MMEMSIDIFPKDDYKDLLPNHKPGIYFFYDENKKLLYIGKSTNVRNRINHYFSYWSIGHLHDKFNEFVKYISVQFVSEDTDIKAMEKELIQKHRPPLNVEYNQKYTKRYSDEYKSKAEIKAEEELNRKIAKSMEGFRIG